MNTLESELGEILIKKKLTIATAESCTGGLIANRITNIPGSSKYFESGLITYSNQSKIELLNVPEDIIKQNGAVSRECARAMALGIKALVKTDLGLAVTGIAGPSGGIPEKPVGLVYIAFALDDSIEIREFKFNGNRLEIKQQTSDEALKLILRCLNKN